MKTKFNYSIPLRNDSGKVALPEIRMDLSSASYPRMLLLLMAIAVITLTPSSMKAVTTTMNFSEAASSKQYYETRFSLTQGDNYSAISGAKVGGIVTYRNQGGNGDLSFDISRIAFSYNSNAGIFDQEGSGFYMYAERIGNPWYRGLYTGQWSTKLAVLNLKPGDKVTFTYLGSTQSGDNANLHVENSTADYVIENKIDAPTWMFQTTKGNEATAIVDFNAIGDLIVSANKGTMIKSIVIESNVAKYDITTVGSTTTFEFTKGGLLDENDFAIPYMSFSFGNKNDFLVVGDDLQSRMFKSDGTETLQTDANIGWQPVAGNFYAFKPTGGGTITVEGGIQGQRTHLFIYNNNTGGWEGKDDKIYAATYNTDDDHYISFSFNVEKDKTYYICINNWDTDEHGNAFHLHKFIFTNTFRLNELAKIVDLGTDVVNNSIRLTEISGAGSNSSISIKRCTGNIIPASVTGSIVNEDGKSYLTITKPSFVERTDNAGTIILNVETSGGDAAFVVTFPYHADFNNVDNPDPYRTYGHTWNFIDPRNSDSNIGNCIDNSGQIVEPLSSGILSIGQYKNPSSQFYYETENREWTYSQRQTGSAGGFHDPFYRNVYDMVGDNADMIWETEGLWFDTETNLSCIYNEKNALVWDEDLASQGKNDLQVGNPLNFYVPRMLKDDGVTPADPIGYDAKGNPLYEDPDRYVGLLPDAGGASSFKIPGLLPGDRVLIFMKSGEGSGTNGVFLNVYGAKDALGNPISTSDLYKAGGTNWQHNRYEGCYHFIKDETTDPNSRYGSMKFVLKAGSMCKLLYIRIYQGERISTTNIVSQTSDDAGKLLFINDKGATSGSGSQMSLRFRGKGQNSTTSVLTYSGSLNASSFAGDYFKVSGQYNHLLDFKSKVGEVGMFRLRMNDVTYEYERNANQKITYVADFSDRNFTVGYRDKVDSYPYTWDFTDIQGFSSSKMDAEADNYPIAAAANDAYGYEWDISLFDADGNMKVNTGWDPITNNLIFSPHKIGFGNQLWAGGDVIPETRGLWFYSEDDSDTDYTSEYSSSLYNDCLQITADGIRFANVPDDAGKRVAWWNYKMVVPDVPANAAVYLRMKRDFSVTDNAQTLSNQGGEHMVPFLATRFQFASQSGKTELLTTNPVTGNANYAFYKVDGADDEWILSVKNTTGNKEHLTFTLNGWIVKKVAVSTDSKTVNKLGWNTESRDHAIDPSLLPYMTGKDFRTYIVTGVSAENKTATLARIDGGSGDDLENTKGKLFVPAANNGSINSCIIRNAGGEAVDLFGTNSGFHLFVPDMHDDATAKSTSLAGNLLKARVTATSDNDTVPRTENGNNNYAFTFKYKKVDENGNAYTDAQEGVQAFYRIVSGGAKSGGNQAYLSIPQVIASSRAAVRAEEAAATPESYTLVFKDWYDLEGEKGDVNGDGLVNEADMELAKDYVTVRKSNGLFKRMGDMNDDGNVDIVDLTLLIKKIMGE